MATIDLLGAYNGRGELAISVLRDEHASTIQVVLDGTNSYDGGYTYPNVIRAGWLLGRNTTTGLYAPVKCTKVVESPATAATSNTVTVVNAAAFVVGDVISIGAVTGRTITAVDYTLNKITFSSTAINAADGDVVKVTNGYEKAIAILLDTVELRDPENRNPANKQVNAAVRGFVRSASVKGDYSVASGVSGNALSQFIFDVNYGYSS